MVAFDQGRGYWQGMNFLCGFLLLLFSEEDTFWIMVRLLDTVFYPVLGAHGPRAEMQLLSEVLAEKLPRLSDHFAEIGLAPDVFSASWLMCAFTTTLPSETAMRIWDLLVLAQSGLDVTPESPPRDGQPAKRSSTPVTPGLALPSGSMRDPAFMGSDLMLLVALAVLEMHQEELLAQTEPSLLYNKLKQLTGALYNHDVRPPDD